MKTVFIAGATGYLGQFLAQTFHDQGWRVHALVRNAQGAKHIGLQADLLVEAQATDPETLIGHMENVDLVVSTLGITRQKDGLTYWDVDYQANLNLLSEALHARVPHFCYVHVLNAKSMPHVELVQAKQAFVDKLKAVPIGSTIIEPTGYFSDMGDFLSMAKSGRAYLFGKGEKRLNPIHGADLAVATYEAIVNDRSVAQIGGPDIFTHAELADLAFAALNKPSKITFLPNWLARAALWLLPKLTPQRTYGPIQFFLSAMQMDMVASRHGTRHLKDHFATLNLSANKEHAK